MTGVASMPGTIDTGTGLEALCRGLRELLRCEESEFVPLHAPRLNARAKAYVDECVETHWVSPAGSFVERFERGLARYTGSRNAVAVNSGTSALHTCLHLLDVGLGDAVIMPSLSFVATANAVSYTGAQPVFLDIDPRNLGLSAGAVEFYLARSEQRAGGERACPLTGRTLRAVLPVHAFGFPADVRALRDVCSRYGLPLVEDAAESIGSRVGGVHTGRFGVMSVLSFNGNKILTTGGGGCILTDDDELARRARHVTSTAKLDHPWEYRHDELGFNYRMPNINAALGCGQLPEVDGWIRHKRALAERYRTFFDAWGGLDFFIEPEGTYSNYWLNAVLVRDPASRDPLLEALNRHGLMSRPAWTPLHELPMYRDCARGDLSQTLDIARRLVNIPSSPYLDR